jgi:hypothetical protein
MHIYQAQQIGAAVPTDSEQPVSWALWNEGLATYVSWKLNPTLTAPEIFWIPRDMEAQMQPHLAQAAQLNLMAKQLDRGDLAQLARMSPDQVRVEARKFLTGLAEKK